MACRDETKAAQAVDDVKKSVAAASKVSFMHLDLASLTSVRDFVAAFSASKFGFYVTLFRCLANVKPEKVYQHPVYLFSVQPAYIVLK